MHEPEQREQAPPGAAPLLHCVRVARPVRKQLGVQRPDAVTLLIQGLGGTIGARGKQVSIFSVEQKDQAQQDGQQPLIQMRGALGREAFHPLAVGGVQAAQQLVQGTEDLGGQLGGDFRLCLTARVQQVR
jgi:hypothetical protein